VTWTERAAPPASTLNIISLWAAAVGDAWLVGSVPGVGGLSAVGTFRWREASGWTEGGDAVDPVRPRRAFRAVTGAAPERTWGRPRAPPGRTSGGSSRLSSR